ncbi:MAG: SDR family NAD(P)-dependent oxidoreductase [Candidatus Vogelbacteria bacterium]|nr:SDR family NAD(P)-dependent oxidoreductase [Candidatus Vogelbacteria bacterium]
MLLLSAIIRTVVIIIALWGFGTVTGSGISIADITLKFESPDPMDRGSALGREGKMKLENKVALITGASRVIGKAIARFFAREGHLLALNYNKFRTDIEKADLHKEMLGLSAQRVLLVQADVASAVELSRMVDEVVTKFGRIDILINNAGILPRTEFLESIEEDWDRTFDTNLKSVYFLSQLVAKHMIVQKSGKIINIASQS